MNVLRPEADLGASAYPVPRATTVVGNDGYVLLARLHDPTRPKRRYCRTLDAQSRWSLVRRLVGVTRQRYELVSGRDDIHPEQAEPQTSDLHVVAYEPYSEHAARGLARGRRSPVQAGWSLLLGPLDAFGPSVKTE